MAATKRALWGALEAGLTDACKAGATELISMWGHPDQEEGPRAFAEKRDATVATDRVQGGAPAHDEQDGVTAGLLLARVLAAGGIGAAYGRPLDGVPVSEVADPAVAMLLAQAHRAVHGVAAVAHVGEGTLVVPGPRPDGQWDTADTADAVVVDDVESVRALAPLVAHGAAGAARVLLRVRVDLAQPVPDGPLARPLPAEDWVEPDEALLRGVARARRVVVLAGPGVVERRAAGSLRALAAAGRLGVLNTWGAKGVFHWQSRHHWATVGLAGAATSSWAGSQRPTSCSRSASTSARRRVGCGRTAHRCGRWRPGRSVRWLSGGRARQATSPICRRCASAWPR